VKSILTGDYRKEELLEAARSGNEEKLVSLLTPLNVSSHASDGRKSTVIFSKLNLCVVFDEFILT